MYVCMVSAYVSYMTHVLLYVTSFLCVCKLYVAFRVSNKLRGKDFGVESLDVKPQVQRLIEQATATENLCQCYIGWCPLW